MAHRQRNLVCGVLPRIKTHLRVGREMHGLLWLFVTVA
jgi:hypothetical protein